MRAKVFYLLAAVISLALIGSYTVIAEGSSDAPLAGPAIEDLERSSGGAIGGLNPEKTAEQKTLAGKRPEEVAGKGDEKRVNPLERGNKFGLFLLNINRFLEESRLRPFIGSKIPTAIAAVRGRDIPDIDEYFKKFEEKIQGEIETSAATIRG